MPPRRLKTCLRARSVIEARGGTADTFVAAGLVVRVLGPAQSAVGSRDSCRGAGAELAFGEMIRLLVVIAILAAGVVVVKQRADDVGSTVPAAPQVNTAQIPPEFRRLLADAPDPASILRERGALPGLGAIRRFAGGGSDDSSEPRCGRSPTSGRLAS